MKPTALYPKIKVCGMTQPDQCAQLTHLGVDFLGFIFYEKSPRFVRSHLRLEEIKLISHPLKIGVFVNEKADNIIDTVTKAGLQGIQLHGNESVDFVGTLRRQLPDTTVIKVIRIGKDSGLASENLAHFNQNQNVDALLFDTDSAAFGGTGKTFDWHILNALKISKPYFLSGGLSADNIENLKQITQRPSVLDINSKFETEPGIKNIELIKDFILKIRQHDL